MIQEIWYCILMAEIGIGASFEQFPSYTESILRTLKKKIKFSVYWRNILCRCVTMKARQPWGHASRVMESRQSRKSGTRPRVCRTCGQHHSHHEPHIYDYPEEVSQQIKFLLRVILSNLLETTNKTLSVSRDPPIILIQPRYSSSLARETKFC